MTTPAEYKQYGEKQSEAEKVTGSNTIVPLARPDPTQPLDIVRGQWAKARPRVVLLGTLPPFKYTPSFPPGTPRNINNGGTSYVSGVLPDVSGLTPTQALNCAAVIEYGVGAQASRAFCDWLPGAINLPPCDYVNVQALPWGDGWDTAVGQVIMSASVAPGQQPGAHVPTATGVFVLSTADAHPAAFAVPDLARAVDIELFQQVPRDPYGVLVPPLPKLQLTGAAYAVRDYAAGSAMPGWGPVEVDRTCLLYASLTAGADAYVRLRWYLQL